MTTPPVDDVDDELDQDTEVLRFEADYRPPGLPMTTDQPALTTDPEKGTRP